MISQDFITEWRQSAPWVRDVQVEMDLIISRALVEMYSQPAISKAFAFRGGTALYKLHLTPPPRYSEDIDLVQVRAEPIGPSLTTMRAVLDPWLGEPRRYLGEARVQLVYRARSGGSSPLPMKLKIEINTREHFTVFGHETCGFGVESRWFSGAADIVTYNLDEMLATKLRALYQRKKGRDLFDIWYALKQPGVSPRRIVEAFQVYMEREGNRISRAEFEENLFRKMREPRFTGDISDLLAPETAYDPRGAYQFVATSVLGLLPGEPWRAAEA